MTTFEYDDEGRVSRAITVKEPEFSAWDRVRLLADRADSLIVRGSHGRPLSEATDPKNKDAYRVPLPTTDFAAQALARERKKYAKQWGDDAMTATLWTVEFVNPSEEE